jgi:hypothetical protein
MASYVPARTTLRDLLCALALALASHLDLLLSFLETVRYVFDTLTRMRSFQHN